MIPKIIHYCWFGRGKKSKLIIRCIESWKKYCTDWEIIEWNEDNFDVFRNTFCRDAYMNKKWAFVSDYARFFALNKMGGVYLDTDVEIIKPIDLFLQNDLFAGYETNNWVAPGLILGSVSNHSILKQVLNEYDKAIFIDDNGQELHKTVGEYFTEELRNNGIEINGKTQIINGIAIYSKEYFCPFDDTTGVLTKTENTYTVHWYSKTWLNPMIRVRTKITRVIHRYFGKDLLKKLR